MADLEDILGSDDGLDDILGGPVKKSRKTVKAVSRASKKRASDYKPLNPPKNPLPTGIFAVKAEKGKNLGRTCLNPDCKAPLKHGRGRPPIVCGKKSCFRFYRNAYRAEYDRARGAA